MAVLYLKYIEGSLPIVLHGALCLLAYVVWLALALIVIPAMVVFKLFNFMETSFINWKKVSTVFSPFDVPFLHETEENRNFIVGIIELEGIPSVNKLRKWVTARLVNNNDPTYTKLRQKVSESWLSYVWEDEENFNIHRHLPIYKGDLPRSKHEIEQLCSKLTDLPFPENISPWMFQLIPKRCGTGSYMYVKIHHVIGDGFAMIGLLSELVDNKPQFMKLPDKPTGVMSNKTKRIVSGILTGPLALLTVALSRNMGNPFKASQNFSSKTVSWTNPINLESLKEIKNKTNTTVNDVVMSCLAGALRKYLLQHEQSLDDQPIIMTFNSRSLSQKKSANKVPLGNRSGGLFLNLPISMSDPLSRLNTTRDRINQLKQLPHGHVFSFVYFKIVSSLPNTFSRLSTFSMQDQTSMIVSNVAGPVAPMHIQGARVKSIVFSPPLHGGIGVAASVFSYNGKIHLTVMSDQKIVNQPTQLTQAFEQEVEALRQSLNC